MRIEGLGGGPPDSEEDVAGRFTSYLPSEAGVGHPFPLPIDSNYQQSTVAAASSCASEILPPPLVPQLGAWRRAPSASAAWNSASAIGGLDGLGGVRHVASPHATSCQLLVLTSSISAGRGDAGGG